MSERDFHAEAVEIVAKELCVPNPKWLTDDRARPAEKLAVREYERNLRGDDLIRKMVIKLFAAEALIRRMVEMSKEEGLVDFSDWVKAAEKYLEGK